MPNTNALEYMILQQLFGGGAGGAGQVWLQVAMLVCLFVTGIYRPEVVRAKPLFRLACILFAISILISPTLNLLLSYLMQMGNSGPSYGRISDESAMLFSFPSMISAVLFGLSVICGLSSLGLGAASSARSKSPQSVSGLTARSTVAPPAGELTPRRPASPGGVHPLDEPD